MKSRITIEVNFDESNTPVIQVLSQSSDDVRDKLIQSFLQSLQHTSRWCKIIYMGNRSIHGTKESEVNPVHCWNIVTIKPSEIPSEIKLMKAIINEPPEGSFHNIKQ